MPGDPRYVYLLRIYMESSDTGGHRSKVTGVWPIDPASLTPADEGVRACPFHRDESTTSGSCRQCRAATLPVKYVYQGLSGSFTLLMGEVGLLVLDPELPAAAEPATPEEPVDAGEPAPATAEGMRLATPKRLHTRKKPVATS